MAAALAPPAKRWTYEDYYRLEDDRRYEIIDGALVTAPAPDTWHQNWILELASLLRAHARQAKLGRVFVAPIDVVLDGEKENSVQPDVVFIAAANAGIVQRRAIFGVPDLVVELVSPSSVRRDRYDKKALYARFGVKEYWIGDAANRSLEILTLRDGAYALHACAEDKGNLASALLPGLEFDLADIQ